MKELGFFVFQFLNGERIGLGKHTLFPVVLILSVNIFKINGLSTRQDFYLNAFGP